MICIGKDEDEDVQVLYGVTHGRSAAQLLYSESRQVVVQFLAEFPAEGPQPHCRALAATITCGGCRRA